MGRLIRRRSCTILRQYDSNGGDGEYPAPRYSGHKQPWGVESIELVAFDSYFSVFFDGNLAELSTLEAHGKQLWMESCMSCHIGPDNATGGTKSGRPFQLITAHADESRFFKRFIRNPKGFNPAAVMEAKPDFSDEEVVALTAFLAKSQ